MCVCVLPRKSNKAIKGPQRGECLKEFTEMWFGVFIWRKMFYGFFSLELELKLFK